MKISIRNLFSKCDQIANTVVSTADLVTFTEEILNGKLHLLCSDIFLEEACYLTLSLITMKNGQIYFKNLTVLTRRISKVVLPVFNPSCPDSGRREKINVNFYCHTSLWCPTCFEAPQRRVKRKFKLVFI